MYVKFFIYILSSFIHSIQLLSLTCFVQAQKCEFSYPAKFWSFQSSEDFRRSFGQISCCQNNLPKWIYLVGTFSEIGLYCKIRSEKRLHCKILAEKWLSCKIMAEKWLSCKCAANFPAKYNQWILTQAILIALRNTINGST